MAYLCAPAPLSSFSCRPVGHCSPLLAAPAAATASPKAAAAARRLSVEDMYEFADRYKVTLTIPEPPHGAAPPSGLSVSAAAAVAASPPWRCGGGHAVVVRVAAPAPGYEARLELLCPVVAGQASGWLLTLLIQ
jgi:hypothetical protein